MKQFTAEQEEILRKWGQVANQYERAIHFKLSKECYRGLKSGVKTFLDDPNEKTFREFWNQDMLWAAQMGGNAKNVLNKWERNGKTIPELQKLIKEVYDSNKYNEDWEQALGAHSTLRELYGKLHIEEYPMQNSCANYGLEFFGYKPQQSYADFQKVFKEFKNGYQEVVGHATKDTDHEVPINFEIDQLFNVIHKVEWGDLEKEDNVDARDFYELVLEQKFGDPKCYWKISPGENANYWDVWRDEEFIAIGWDKIDVSKGNIQKQVEEKYPDGKVGYITKQFGYFTDDMKEGDVIVAYGNNQILGIGEITGEYHFDEGAKEYKHRRDVEWIDSDPKDVRQLETTLYNKLKQRITILKLTKDEYLLIENREKLRRYGEFELNLKIEKLGQKFEIKNLYFEPETEGTLVRQITAALKNGKHIILIGPPGTGKSKLAKEICDFYCDSGGYTMTTATSDWSTFDTIGGYMPDESGKLKFNPGVFLKCFHDENDTPINKWLIIDEINRADIDKAFGEMFSALTGDNISLPLTRNNKAIEIIGSPNSDDEVESHRYFIPEDWRIIATMNTFDKTSLYEMSYAFMRRFAFIPVDIPKEIKPDLITEYLKKWTDIEIDGETTNRISEIWGIINEHRKIGPAIIEDIYRYVETSDDFTSALIVYVLPQFEGLDEDKLVDFTKKISEEINDNERLISFVSDYFEIHEGRFKK